MNEQQTKKHNNLSKKYGGLILLTLLFYILFSILIQENSVIQSIDTNISSSFFKNTLYTIVIPQIPALLWILGTILFVKYTKIFFWEIYFLKIKNRRLPKIVIDIYSIFIWIASCFLSLIFLFKQDITGLLTTSSVLIGVLGFSLRSLISDFFYGLAMTIEQPFRIGDWIEVNNGSSLIGKVDHITWRSTTLITTENIHAVLPHSIIAASHFNNYSYPDPLWRSNFKIILPNEITMYEAERIIFSAIKQVKESAKIHKEPSIKVIEFLPHGIEWMVCFWVKDYEMESSVRLKIQRNILRNLNYSGIALPSEKLEISAGSFNLQSKNNESWARKLDLFASLDETECKHLSDKAIRRLLFKGNELFEQGSEGSSLFFVYQGLLDVFVKNKNNANENVAQLGAGSVLGEMSLLTGEPRTATIVPNIDTVVYEIKKEMIEPYLHEYPLLLEHIEKLLAERKLQNARFLEQVDGKNQLTRESVIADIRQKITRFFNLPII